MPTMNEWPSSQICMDCKYGKFVMGEDIPASTYTCESIGPCNARLSGKMQKIIHTDKIPDNCATKGLHPNLFPDGWREIDVGEFAQSSFFTYSPSHVEYRQMYDDHSFSSKMIAAKLFHFSDGTGIAMSNEWWDKKVRYFKFGCDHKYNELGMNEAKERGFQHHGMCWHVYECATCGHVMSQDSSD